MRLNIVDSKNASQFYVIKSYRRNGRNTSKIVEKLGTLEELSKIHEDPVAWANSYIEELNRKEREQQREVIVKFSQSKRIDRGVQVAFNGGYLFLQKIYHELKIDRICSDITKKYRFEYNLDSILSRLIYGRILFPASKLGTVQLSKRLLEQPDFDLHQVYRALEVIAAETDFIQAELYKNTLRHSKRNDRVLYYDCTNFFFEIEETEGLKQYGPSKENRPNPIVELGLFMDADGIPLAFCVHGGNTNEQTTLKPLEEQIIKDFNLSRFVVCTDAGLSAVENRKFNNKGGRAFITTQSLKKQKKFLRQWALDPVGWRLASDEKESGTFDIGRLAECEEGEGFYHDEVFFKERWIKEDGLEQRLIVTYSIKYRNYQRSIRDAQIERAAKLIESRPDALRKKNQNDYRRFIKQEKFTADGEVATKTVLAIDNGVIDKEEAYDGFYGVCTNLEDDACAIAAINKRRWEVEESFRIMKTDFEARPVFLKRDDRIKAHFTTCVLALTLFRYLEKKLDEKHTSSQIIRGLQNLNFLEIPGEGFVPSYVRNDFTDDIHDKFGFHTDFQIVTEKYMKKILRITKK